MDATWTIFPAPRRCISTKASCESWKQDERFVANVRSHSSTSTTAEDSGRTCPCAVTSTSSPPSAWTASPTARAISSRSARSAITTASRPRSAAGPSAIGAERPMPATTAPSARKPPTMPEPMPPQAPVTIARLPASNGGRGLKSWSASAHIDRRSTADQPP